MENLVCFHTSDAVFYFYINVPRSTEQSKALIRSRCVPYGAPAGRVRQAGNVSVVCQWTIRRLGGESVDWQGTFVSERYGLKITAAETCDIRRQAEQFAAF